MNIIDKFISLIHILQKINKFFELEKEVFEFILFSGIFIGLWISLVVVLIFSN